MVSESTKARAAVGRPHIVRWALLQGITWLALACIVPMAASAQDYPGGALATGVVTRVYVANAMLRFEVSGTMDNGTSGTQAFWIDSSAVGGSLRAANILSAAAQGKTVSIWNYGDVYSYGGQTGYLAQGEWTNF